jgi:hypothetical protein
MKSSKSGVADDDVATVEDEKTMRESRDIIQWGITVVDGDDAE